MKKKRNLNKKASLLVTTLSIALILASCGTAPTPDTSSHSSETTSSTSEMTNTYTGDAADLPGILHNFTTMDLEGNAVDQSVLEDYTLTMVNVWATFCGPCLREMPDLGELAEEYKENGVQFIGLVSDTMASDGSIDENQVQTAKDVVASTGANYIHLLPSNDLYGLLSQIYAVPTTFFVDKDGNQVGQTYVQSMTKEEWIKVIDEVLAEVNP